MGIKLGAIKKSFFDRQKVAGKVEKARMKNLSKCGAYVRQRAKSSLRRRKKASAPYRPPSIHSQKPLLTLKSIFFGYEPRRKSVFVGPVAVYGNKQDVPRLMEVGGTAVRNNRYVAKYTKAGKRKKLELERTKALTRVQYPPRPFMRPAMLMEKAKFAKVWKNTIKA